MGVYKFENGDVDAAEKIFENLAVIHDFPPAWIYLGSVKFLQINSEKTTVKQVLNCYLKARELNPSGYKDFQKSYYNYSLGLIEYFCNKYSETKKEINKANSKMWGNAALGGLSLLVGNNTKNRTFGAIAGSVGAGVAGYHTSKNITQKRDAKQLLSFYSENIKQLIDGVKFYCSDGEEIYPLFKNKIELLGLSAYL